MDQDTERLEHDLMTSDREQRLRDRTARLRRDHVRRKSQRVGLVIVLVALVILGAAYALRSAASPTPTPSAPGIAASVATRTLEASAASESPHATETTAVSYPVGSASASPTASAPASAALKPLSPAPGVKTIVLDRSEQHVTLYKANGAPVDRFPCATGTYYPLVGTYEVFGHAKQSWSLTDNTTFFYFTKFTESAKDTTIGFHSIPENPDGSLVGGLGKPDSHGCVRLAKDKARFLYAWAATGTRVVVKR
jgi:lipoprotein-anchoring transpeptidase ErfK/SrfK